MRGGTEKCVCSMSSHISYILGVEGAERVGAPTVYQRVGWVLEQGAVGDSFWATLVRGRAGAQ